MADWVLPRSLLAQHQQAKRAAVSITGRTRPERRVIVVTFGGGVRFEDTLAPQGWINIPHLANEIVPQGLVYPRARYEGITGHFNSTGALVTGCRQEVDAYGSEAPVTPTIFELLRKEHGLPPEEAWVIATNKSFSLMGGSKLRDFGDPYSANVILPKQLLLETIKSAVSTDAGPGVEDRQALAERMMLALDEGYEGFGWRVFDSGRALGAELKATLAKSLLDYFNDPSVPTSGDELTCFMTKEIMTRLAPSLARRQLLGHRHRALRRVFAVSRSDPPHRSAGERAVAARATRCRPTRTRRRCWSCRSWGGMAIRRATASRIIAAATNRAAASGSSRSARACRKARARIVRSRPPMWRRRWRRCSGSR